MMLNFASTKYIIDIRLNAIKNEWRWGDRIEWWVVWGEVYLWLVYSICKKSEWDICFVLLPLSGGVEGLLWGVSDRE